MLRKNIPLFILILQLCWPAVQAQTKHDYLHDLYDQLHDSPMQQKFRQIAPMPTGVVYIQRPGEGEKEIREHFRTMKKLGFNSLKQIMLTQEWNLQEVQLIALEEGLVPWWYGEGGWVPITNGLLKDLGIESSLSRAEIREHPDMQAYQMNALKERVEKTIKYIKEDPNSNGQAPRSSNRAYDPTVGNRGLDLSEKGRKLFIDWVKETYQNIETVNLAYNQDHANLAVKNGGAFKDWEDFAERWDQYNHREYRVRRDIMRFKADHALKNIQKHVDVFHSVDPNAPFRGGGELGLFRPQAWFCVDFEGIADVMKDAGSFYPSIHYSWHFDQVEDEVLRSTYMQASIMTDYFKGGWSAAWECTGGPQQFDGEKFGHPDKGFTVDAANLTQFFLSHLAGGFKGFGIWAWSPRTAGKEAGEYSLLGRHNEVTDRAIAVGKIGQAMQLYRDELWTAHKEPLVGILSSWDNEAIWAALSDRGREDFRFRPMQAKVGISNTLISANVPFEYVTPDDIRKGLAARYPIIYLPAILAVNPDVMESLSDYVEQGGRLVIDMPGAWYDDYSQLYPTNQGTTFEKTFGVVIQDYQYAGRNRPWHLQGQELLGSIGELKPTHAKTLATFENGKPAITEAKFGKGTAVVLGYEAARSIYKSDDPAFERILLNYTLSDMESPFACEGALVYRLASPNADHYFLMNEGKRASVVLDTKDFSYTSAKDAVSGEELRLGQPIELEAYSGRWIRFEK